jgi:predicted CXXCH cytochrome family protein
LALLFVGGAVWLFLAAIPVLADGGPHVKTINNGSLGINADGCAGCHRAHTAQGAMLLKAEDEEAFCLTCHGSAVVGATTDVMNGVQYTLAGTGLRDTTLLGALRGGGFDQARLDAGNVSRLSYLRNATDVSQRPKVGVGAAEPVTSAHLALPENGLTATGIAWGNGAAGTGAGPAVDLNCASCHNPHGNGQFRILNTIPEATGTGFSDDWVVTIRASYAAAVAAAPPLPAFAADTIYTLASSALLVGDQVAIAGHSNAALNGTWFVQGVSGVGFTISATSGGAAVDITVNGTGGTVTRLSGVPVTDATLPPANDTRNYTIMETKGTEGTESTYLLLASQVKTAAAANTFNGIAGNYTATGGDFFARNVPWSPLVNNAACVPTVFPAPAACATANSAPNGRPSTFSSQITAWCSSCHTRYFANNNPDPANTAVTGASWAFPRPGDDLYKYQHRTVAGRDCLTCHVSHGSNAVMTGTYSSTYAYPNGTASASSRLLKIDNRGTCQACHDPTGTVPAGTYVGPANPTVP